MMMHISEYVRECSMCVDCEFPAEAIVHCKSQGFHPRELAMYCTDFRPNLEIIAPASVPGMSVQG